MTVNAAPAPAAMIVTASYSTIVPISDFFLAAAAGISASAMASPSRQ